MSDFSFTSDTTPKIDVAGTGFFVLDRLYIDGKFSRESLGGSCGNVIASLAMLNHSALPVLAIGDDEEGDRIVDELSQAGAITCYIGRRSDIRSPIIVQAIDTKSAEHHFSFKCPQTNIRFPRYQPIGQAELTVALPVLSRCKIFYTDRLSDSIVDAMRAAWSAGAIVFFEPSDIKDFQLFEAAIGMVAILKYSADRLRSQLSSVPEDCIRIVTHGASGLEVAHRDSSTWSASAQAPAVLDTCGSGDMVSVGIIDWMLSNSLSPSDLTAERLFEGVVAGQRLAAENCAYAGARGLFREKGSDYARQVLRRNSVVLNVVPA